jgi:hypothetical protein
VDWETQYLRLGVAAINGRPPSAMMPMGTGKLLLVELYCMVFKFLVKTLAGVKLPVMIKDVCVGAKVSELLVVELDKVVDDPVDVVEKDDEIVVDVLNEEDEKKVEDVDGVEEVESIEDEVGGKDADVDDVVDERLVENVESVVEDSVVDLAVGDESIAVAVDDTELLVVLESEEVVDTSAELEDVDVVKIEEEGAAEICW